MSKGEIYVTSWDDHNQYSSDGTPVAYWHEKSCNWIIYPEFEEYDFKYDTDSNGITDIPRACTLKYAKEWCGYNEDCPDINMRITYLEDGKEYSVNRYWGHLNYSEDDAIKNIGEYYRDKVLKDMTIIEMVIMYNDKLIWTWKATK